VQHAIDLLRALPNEEQDAIAQLIIGEMESEKQWDALFAKSPEKLKRLADRAWAEHDRKAD
jgi:hypothetical protein